MVNKSNTGSGQQDVGLLPDNSGARTCIKIPVSISFTSISHIPWYQRSPYYANTGIATSNVDSGAPGRGILVLQDFDEIGLRDGFSNSKLLDDFGCGDLTRPEHVFRQDQNHHRHRQLGLSRSPKPQAPRRTKRRQIIWCRTSTRQVNW